MDVDLFEKSFLPYNGLSMSENLSELSNNKISNENKSPLFIEETRDRSSTRSFVSNSDETVLIEETVCESMTEANNTNDFIEVSYTE